MRIAYNLGLNLDCQKWVHQKKITEEEAEIRRITWWGCYLLDKCVRTRKASFGELILQIGCSISGSGVPA